MKASRHSSLGRVVAAVNQMSSDLDEDPMNDYAGFTPDPTFALESLVQAEGFANLMHFRAVVEFRTSQRFAHFHVEA